MKNIGLSEFFEVRHITYKYIKITPHKSIRNYNSVNVAKAITNTYRTVSKRVTKERKKYKWLKCMVLQNLHKISYVIDIQGGNANFYFIVPNFCLDVLLEKIREIWNRATVTVLEEGLKPFSENCETYSLSYKKEDALSLQVDRKSNEPLNTLLNVMEIMKEEDRLMIIYNFQPCSQWGWKDQYQTTMKKIMEKKSIDKKKLSAAYILHNGTLAILNALESVLNVINDFLGNNNATGQQESLMTSIMGVLERQDDLSPTTKRKKEATIVNTQIAVISESKDEIRQTNNALSVCQSFRVLDEDNELTYKKEKHIKDIEKYSICEKHNIMSCEEAGGFIQIPARNLLQQYKIDHVKVEEAQIPKELQKGFKNLGVAKYKGTATNVYFEDEYNIGNLPLALTGIMGAGKSSFIGSYCYDSCINGESAVIIDFIKECEMAEEVKRVLPKDRIVEIDLGTKEGIQGFGYNEIKIKDDMPTFTKLELASMQANQIMAFVDSIGEGTPLSSRMRRFLYAAAMVVFVQGDSSIKNAMECLQKHNKRRGYIDNLSEEVKFELDDEINTLKELDEWSKETKNNPSQIVGTMESKIEGIIDRVSIISGDFKLKYMYNKSIKDNINLVDCMESGKVVLFKIRESKFMTKMHKNILATYLVSKVWMASQLRGALHKKPARTNIIIDEVFQAPTCMKNLEYILPQSRKFGTKFIFSVQHLKQFANIEDTLQASGTSYMLLKGTIEEDFNEFSNKLEGFEWDDLFHLERFHSLNLIQYSGGYASFITKLPYIGEDEEGEIS